MGSKCLICKYTGCKQARTTHRFPSAKKYNDIYQKWIEVLKKNDIVADKDSTDSRICQNHFNDEDYYVSRGKRWLKHNSVPTVLAKNGINEIDVPVESTSGASLECYGTVESTSDCIPGTSSEYGTTVECTPVCTTDTLSKGDIPTESTADYTLRASSACGLPVESILECIPPVSPEAKMWYERCKNFKKIVIAQKKTIKRLQQNKDKRLQQSRAKRSQQNRVKRLQQNRVKRLQQNRDKRTPQKGDVQGESKENDFTKLKVFITHHEGQYSKKRRSRRYPLEVKSAALSVLKESPTQYRVIRKMFPLPSKRTLMRVANKPEIQVGVSENVINNLKAILISNGCAWNLPESNKFGSNTSFKSRRNADLKDHCW